MVSASCRRSHTAPSLLSSTTTLTLILAIVVMQTMSTEARQLDSHIQLHNNNKRAPTQSEESKNNNKSGSTTIAIAASVSVILFALLGFAIYKGNAWYRKKQGRNGGPGRPEMAQTSLLRPGGTTTTGSAAAGTRPTRSRPRRQPSTQTVPEYSEQAGDEEMILGKAEEAGEQVRIEIASPEISIIQHDVGSHQSSPRSRNTSADTGSSSLTNDSSHETAAAHYAATQASTSIRRTSAYLNNASRTTLQDILNPAPELRMDRVDTYDTTYTTTRAPSIISSSENSHQLLVGGGGVANGNPNNDSNLSLPNGTGFDDVNLDTATPSPAFASSASRRSSSSFFASPAYVNRSRSRSIDISRTISIGEGESDNYMQQQYPRNTLAASSSSRLVPPSPGSASGSSRRNSAGGQSLDVPRPSNSRTASIMGLLSRRQSQTPQSSLLPTHHQNSPDSRREALRNREISAPISDTLVRTSYVFPKAGINPVQAAWLGSRDHINRLTTYLDTAPPAFAEEAEDAIPLELDSRTSADAESSIARGPSVRSSLISASAGVNAVNEGSAERPSVSNVLSQMEEESAQLSSLVHQESQRRASLPAHMVALPPSMPVSPISPRSESPGLNGTNGYSGNADWPISRAASLARAHSLARHRLSMETQQSPSNGGAGSPLTDRRTSIARRRVQSDNQNHIANNGSPSSNSNTPVRMSTLPSQLQRSESPTPMSRGNVVGNAVDLTSTASPSRNLRPVLKVETDSASGGI